MNPYCIGCLYCRPLSRERLMHACHLYLDERIKPEHDDNGCKQRRIVSEKERAAYLAAKATTDYLLPPKKRRVEDDYIFDSRGALDGGIRKGMNYDRNIKYPLPHACRDDRGDADLGGDVGGQR